MAKLIITSDYGCAPNSLLNHKDISLKAKALFVFIQSKPCDWEFSAENISRQCKENIEAIQTGLKELEKFGFLLRTKTKNDKGHWTISYSLQNPHLQAENPIAENPGLENPRLENPVLEKPLLDLNAKNPVTENPVPGIPVLENTLNNSNIFLSNNNSSTKVLPDEHSSPVVVEVIAEEVVEEPAVPAKPKRVRPSRKKNPEDYSMVTKMKLIVLEANKFYRWQGLDGSAAKKILEGILSVGRINKNGVEPTEEEVLKYFRIMLNPKFHPSYFKGNWDLKKINNEFVAITSNMQKPGGANGVGKTQKAMNNSDIATQMILDEMKRNGHE